VIVDDHATNGLTKFLMKRTSLRGQHGQILAYSDEVTR